MYTIEIARGARWDQPTEIIDRRDCLTRSLDACIAEARYWLGQFQTDQPHRGATHYRIVDEAGLVIGGPSSQ